MPDFDNPTFNGPFDNPIFQGGNLAGAGGGNITPSLFIVGPLVCQLMQWNGAASSGDFVMSTEEDGVRLVMQLLHTPLIGNLVPAPIYGATLTLHLKAIGGTDTVMVSAPTVIYAPFGIIEMIFEPADMALLSSALYKVMVKGILSDGQIRDFPGSFQVQITAPNP